MCLHAFFHLFLLILSPGTAFLLRVLLSFLLFRYIAFDFFLSLLFNPFLQLFFLKFGLSLGLDISCLLFLDFLGLLNDLLLVLALHEVGNHFPSVNCAWREFGNSLSEQGNLLWGPLLHSLLHLG
jgi:hypothetical protein